jgi:putative ABC transport system ATP-binding protein
MVIVTDGLTKDYHLGPHTVHALRGVSVAVARGEFLAVMGPSGSGKSTFMNVLGCLDTPTDGRYLIDGEDVAGLDRDTLARIRSRKIGFVFQTFNLIPDLHVFDNVDVPLRYRGLPAPDRKARIERALELVGLSSRARHLPSQLSGGQQQRVAIARVLAGDPRLILADEPTGNLDSLMTREIMDLLERINEQGTTIVMVTHSPECAARAQRQIHLLDGKVVDLDAAPSLSRQAALESVG